jgi:hypothetical protein
MKFNSEKMKKIVFAMMALASLTFVACSDDDNGPDIPEATCSDGVQNGSETGIDCGGPDCEPCEDATAPTCSDGVMNGDEEGVDCGGSCPNACPDETEVSVSENITEDTTWSADAIYFLEGRIFVEPGATLTIEPGTIIKGRTGSGANAAVLVVAAGADIIAEGTAEAPIIFTAETDDIAIGQTTGTTLNQNTRGEWGGLIILGNAPGSFDGDAEQAQVEGIPTEDNDFGLYGGSDPEDNSGILRYVSIRYGGIALSEGNEINGLTLGAVGSGTVMDNIEVVANLDDGIEFFGGTVNASNLFVWAQGDDAIDIDQAYSGTIDNVVVVLGDVSDHAFEIDGPEGTLEGSFTLTNATLFGNAATDDGEYADYRSNAMGTTSNVYALDFPGGKDVELDNNGVAQNWLDGLLIFEAWEIVGAGNEIFVERVEEDDEGNELEDLIITNPTFTEAAADWTTTVEAGSQTVGADVTAFAWTYSNATAGLGF